MSMYRIAAVAMLVGLIGAPARSMAISTDIRSYVCAKLDDFVVTGTVGKADQRELRKISKDFGFLYQFKSVTMSYKEPNKVRVEGSVEGTRGVYIVNGTIQVVRVPRMNLRTRRDFGNSPGKRKSLMDMGLVSDYYLTYANAKFMREGKVDATPVAVFELTYKDRDEDTSRHVIYIDPRTKLVMKRESYSQDGKLQCVYHYRNPQEVAPGIFFPTVIEVQNTDRVIAGSTTYSGFKVNTGLADSLFE